jgi:hypothetical protein
MVYIGTDQVDGIRRSNAQPHLFEAKSLASILIKNTIKWSSISDIY